MPAITIWQLGMRRCELLADADLSSITLRVVDGGRVLCDEVMDSPDAALAASERWYVAHEQHVFGFAADPDGFTDDAGAADVRSPAQ